MTLAERLQWATAPVEERSTLLLWGGFAAFIGPGALSALVELPAAIRLLLYALMVCGWGVCACGMVGYVRWYFGQAKKEAREMFSQRPKD